MQIRHQRLVLPRHAARIRLHLWCEALVSGSRVINCSGDNLLLAPVPSRALIYAARLNQTSTWAILTAYNGRARDCDIVRCTSGGCISLLFPILKLSPVARRVSTPISLRAAQTTTSPADWRRHNWRAHLADSINPRRRVQCQSRFDLIGAGKVTHS